MSGPFQNVDHSIHVMMIFTFEICLVSLKKNLARVAVLICENLSCLLVLSTVVKIPLGGLLRHCFVGVVSRYSIHVNGLIDSCYFVVFGHVRCTG